MGAKVVWVTLELWILIEEHRIRLKLGRVAPLKNHSSVITYVAEGVTYLTFGP